MTHEVRTPARDEGDDDAKGHFYCLDFCPGYGVLVAHRPPEGAVGALGLYFLALPPDDAHHVDIAVGNKQSWNDENVTRHEGEIELPLPPCRIALTLTLMNLPAIRTETLIRLNEDEQLRHGKHTRHQPAGRDHLPGPRHGRAEAERPADGEEAVEAHGGQDEGGGGQGDDLRPQEDLTGRRPQHPLPETNEEHLGRHGHHAHR